MGSSAVQKSLIANSVQSLHGPPGPEAVLLRRLRSLVHQSQGSVPFTNFPWDLPGRQPQCWASLLAGKPENAWETGDRRDGCHPQDGNRRQSSFPFHWGPLYRKTTNTKAKSSSGSFPAIYFLTCRHGTNWCRREKTRSKQSSLITMEGFRSFQSL